LIRRRFEQDNAMLIRVLLLSAAALAATPARAELTCEQLVGSAQAAIALRDQGTPLSRVLAETEKAEMRERFRPDELGMIRQAIRLTITGEVSVYELANTCAESRGGKKR
jgi:hypothetical protein